MKNRVFIVIVSLSFKNAKTNGVYVKDSDCEIAIQEENSDKIIFKLPSLFPDKFVTGFKIKKWYYIN